MLPLPIIITLVVVLLAIVLFITELIPPAITAISAACVLVLTGVIPLEDGFAGFSNEATITVLCMLILAEAIQRTGIVSVWSAKVIKLAGGSQKRLLAMLLIVTGLVSAFTNNTPQVAIMIPLIMTVAASLNLGPSRFLMPMAFAATLGGMLTLIGTSTNVLASSVSADLGYGAFSMFEFTKAGLIVFAIGGLYLYFVAPRLLPDRGNGLASGFNLKEYLAEIVVPEGSPLVGKSLEELPLFDPKEVEAVRLVRTDFNLERPPPATRLAAGDILLVRAGRQHIIRIHQSPDIKLLPEVTHWLPAKDSGLEVVEAVIPPGSALAGATLKGFRFRGRFDAVVLAIKKRERLINNPLSTTMLEPGDSLLVSGTPAAMRALRSEAELVIAQDISQDVPRVHHVPTVLGIFLGVVAVATLDLAPISIASLAGVAAVVVTGGLRLDELQRAVRWDVLFLLAGLIPVGIALQDTGAAQMGANWIAGVMEGWPPVAILAVVYAVAMLLTEVMSNNACVAIMLPLSANLANELGLNPFTFILAVTFGASLAFMTPVGYQTYLMVYGPGNYRFSDFVRVGAPLNLIAMAAALFALTMFWPLRA